MSIVKSIGRCQTSAPLVNVSSATLGRATQPAVILPALQALSKRVSYVNLSQWGWFKE